MLLSAQAPVPFKLRCTGSPLASGYIYLTYPINNKWTKDSALMKDGKAEFSGLVYAPTLGRIMYGRQVKEIFLEPGNLAFIWQNDFTRGSFKGSKTQKEFDQLKAAIKKIEDRWKIVLDTLTEVNKRSNVAFQELKEWVLTPYFKEIEETNLEFFNKYPSSYVTAYELQLAARNLTTDSIRLFYNRFPEHLKKSAYGKNIQNEIEKRKRGAIGTMAAGFSKPDIYGDTLKLSELSGKYVLLDFWGSWCVPCRKGNPHLVQTYSKYKDRGLEIVGIAADDRTPAAWRKAVIDDKLPWRHILQGDTPETDLSIKYNIEYYPTKILIDKTGKIIGRFGGESDSLDKMLKEIFN